MIWDYIACLAIGFVIGLAVAVYVYDSRLRILQLERGSFRAEAAAYERYTQQLESENKALTRRLRSEGSWDSRSKPRGVPRGL